MSRKSITDERYEKIKAHILAPEESPLPAHLQEELDRIVSMSKVLDKNPVIKNAVSIHKSKFPHLSDSTAYRDARLARRIYNSLHEFDYDFWLSWLLKDIVDNINACRQGNSHQDRRVIAMEHANLLKAIGEKPDEPLDPHRNEKHQFYILVQINNQNVKLDVNQLKKLPEDTLRELNRVLFSGQEIDEQGAAEIMES